MSPVRQLENFVDRVRRGGLRALSEDELLEFGRAYRRAGALLSRARTAQVGAGEIESLNRLLAAAYPLVHTQTERRSHSVIEFLVDEFPRTFRRELKVIVLATAIFVLGVLFGVTAVAWNPDMADILLGTGWHKMLEQVAERHVDNQDWLPEILRPVASAQIMINNIKVAVLAFATGVLCCLGSFYVLFYNGLLMGAVGVVVHQRAVDEAFWGFVIPHGVVEIPAILMSAAAGLIIGYGFIAPGRAWRSTAVRLAARRAVPLLIGVVIMLVEAGLVEAFISPRTDIEPPLKMALGGLIFACLVAWLAFGGRTARSQEENGPAGRNTRSNAVGSLSVEATTGRPVSSPGSG